MTSITTTLYTYLITFLEWAFSWLPDSTGFPTAVHTAFEQVGAQLNVLNVILPVSEFKIIMGLAFSYYFIKQSIYFVIWIIGVLRGA